MNKFVTKGKFKTVNGSILTPEYAGLRLILNAVNTKGQTFEPLLPVFDKKWKKIKEENKGWYASRNNFKMGEVTTSAVQSDTWVINCLCQEETGEINTSALENCLKKVHSMAKAEKASIHVSNLLLDACSSLNDLLLTKFVDDGVNVSLYTEG